MGVLKTYDFKQVAVIIGGRQITGFAEGDDSVSVEQDSDAWTKTVGADGEVTRSKSNNNAGKIMVKLMKTADSNDFLMGLYNSDKLNNAGLVPAMIKDNSGRALHVAEQAWIKKLPAASYGATAGVVEWEIDVGDMVSTLGGN